MTTPNLSQVCLWTAVGQLDPMLMERTMRMLRYCHSLAEWGGKILFTVMDPQHYPRVEGLRVIQIPQLERARWEVIVGKFMPAILEQYPWTLAVHDDGFPCDLSMWHPDFLQYDYLGAPWQYSGIVGSGGCCLTSARFNRSMQLLPWYDGGLNVDEWCCREQRPRMLELGMRFAPPEVAALFCTEVTDNERPSFAYHGRNHAIEKHKLAWEKLEQWEREAGWKT